MDVITHQQNTIKTKSSQSDSHSQFNFWVSKNRAFLALQAASLLFFLFILLSLRMDFSVFSISFFSFNLGRTHMFILCNGIVAILVKGSVLSDPYEDGEPDLKEIKNVEVMQVIDEISAQTSLEIEKPVVIIEEEEEVVSGCVLVSETEQVDQQFVEDELQEEVEEEEEEKAEELSVEELNKKCDEFIRKMKGVISNDNRSL